MDDSQALHETACDRDDPELIAQGQRYLAWSAVATGAFVVIATFTLHIAHERHERAVASRNHTAYAAMLGADLSRHLPSP